MSLRQQTPPQTALKDCTAKGRAFPGRGVLSAGAGQHGTEMGTVCGEVLPAEFGGHMRALHHAALQ